VNDRVVESPAATAISAWDGELTYGELDRLSTLLATYMLENTSFQAGDIVALCFEKSRWTHVSALAVLKAGGTFVFLDRGQPIDRLQSMLRQTGAAVMLTSASVDASLATSVDTALTICLEFVAFQDTACLSSPAATQLPKPDPKSAMYVIFTSGTTGEPKGTVVSHRAFTTAMTHQAARFGYTRATRAYDFSSYGFDVAISTAFMTLVVGGCLCVPSEEDRHDNLAASIVSTGANLVDLTPSVLRLLDPKQIPQIKTIVLGGEALQASDLVPWASSQVRLKNGKLHSSCTMHVFYDLD
jgi:non-ribosomal peptide synthetase component F